MKRPTSVTVIAWILIVMTVIMALASLATLDKTLNNPEILAEMEKSSIPVTLQIVLSFAGALITLVAGIAMLKAQNWGRLVYVGWGAIAVVIGLFTSPKAMVGLDAAILVIFAFFLFLPQANAWFSGSEAGNEDLPAVEGS